MRRLRASSILAALALVGCQDGGPRVTVEDAVVTLPAVSGRPGAAYFRLETNRDGTRLTDVASAKAGRVELHERGMRPAAGFDFTPAQPLLFEPGGRHAMLFDLDPSLRPGANIALTFSFEGAPPVTAEAEVRAPGDTGHEGH